MAMSESVWRTIDSLIKGLGASVLSGLVLYFGYQMQHDRAMMMQRMERVNATVEFAANQKDLDINIAMRMFERLLSRYFEKDSSQRAARVSREDLLLLRLIALNFQDVPINLKPMYAELDRQLAKQNDKKGRKVLRETAMEVARRQAFRMTFLDGFDSGPKKVKSGDKVKLKNLHIVAEIGEISEDSTEVTLLIEHKPIGPFSVGYFDSPIIDNIKIPGNMRVSSILVSSDGKEATLRIIAFQSDLAADRFDIKELSREFVGIETKSK